MKGAVDEDDVLDVALIRITILGRIDKMTLPRGVVRVNITALVTKQRTVSE